jgi:hypothetical protein
VVFQELQKIQKLIANGRQIKDRIEEHLEEIKNPSCDKHRMGFNVDERSSSARVQVSVDCHRGHYGSSSVYTKSIVRDQEIFTPCFIKVLNKHFNELMDETADLILSDAKAAKEKGIDELEVALAELKEL